MEEKGKGNISIIIMATLVVLLVGGIVYDKVFSQKNNDDTKKCVCEECKKCEESKVDYSTADIESTASVVCTIDMTGLSEVEVASRCEDNFNNGSYQIRLENLKYNDTTYTFTYINEKNDYVPSESDAGIVKMYIGSTLIAAHDGNMRNILKEIKVSGNNFHTGEWAPSDVPTYESNFDLSKIIK